MATCPPVSATEQDAEEGNVSDRQTDSCNGCLSFHVAVTSHNNIPAMQLVL